MLNHLPNSFKLFLDKIDTSFTSGKPYLTPSGYVYWCDCFTFARVKKDELKEKYPLKEYLEISKETLGLPAKDADSTLSVKSIREALEKLDTVDEYKFQADYLDCGECEGTGEVNTTYTDKKGKTHFITIPCPVCEGSGFSDKPERIKTGRKVLPPESTLSFRGKHYKAAGMEKIATLAEELGISKMTILNEGGSGKRIILFQLTDNIQCGTLSVIPNLNPELFTTAKE